jgi:hypothetical protein
LFEAIFSCDYDMAKYLLALADHGCDYRIRNERNLTAKRMAMGCSEFSNDTASILRRIADLLESYETCSDIKEPDH